MAKDARETLAEAEAKLAEATARHADLQKRYDELVQLKADGGIAALRARVLLPGVEGQLAQAELAVNSAQLTVAELRPGVMVAARAKELPRLQQGLAEALAKLVDALQDATKASQEAIAVADETGALIDGNVPVLMTALPRELHPAFLGRLMDQVELRLTEATRAAAR